MWCPGERPRAALSQTGEFVDTFITAPSSILDAPTGIAWDANGDAYVSSFTRHTVVKFNGKTGELIGNFVAPNSGGLHGPDNGLTFGPDGNLYVPSYNNGRVNRYDGVTGEFIDTFIPNTLITRPRVLVFDDDNNLFVTSEGSNAVRRYDATTGEFLGNFTTPGVAGMTTPVGMAFGPDGYLYVTSFNERVYRFDGTTGEFLDIFLSGPDAGLRGPVFITIIPAIPAPPVGAALLPGALLAARRRR